MGAKTGKPPLFWKWWTLVHLWWHFWKALGRATRPQNFVGQSSKTAEIWRWGRKPEKPHFLESDELWSTYGETCGKTLGRATWRQKFCGPKFKNSGDMAIGAKIGKPPLSRNGWTLVHLWWHFWKALGQSATWPQHFVGQSSKTVEIWRWGRKSENPTFSKLMNFGPLMVTHFESTRARLHDPKILWAKVQKRRRYGDKGENRKNATFLKRMNFGPLMVTLLKSPRAGLHDPKILWAKVQKTAEIWRWGREPENPHLLEIGERYWNSVSWVFRHCRPL